jgi:hypothetical protein
VAEYEAGLLVNLLARRTHNAEIVAVKNGTLEGWTSVGRAESPERQDFCRSARLPSP